MPTSNAPKNIQSGTRQQQWAHNTSLPFALRFGTGQNIVEMYGSSYEACWNAAQQLITHSGTNINSLGGQNTQYAGGTGGNIETSTVTGNATGGGGTATRGRPPVSQATRNKMRLAQQRRQRQLQAQQRKSAGRAAMTAGGNVANVA